LLLKFQSLSLICFLHVVGTLEHDLFRCHAMTYLFRCHAMTYFGFCSCCSDLSPLSLFLLFPICWVLCLMKFARVSLILFCCVYRITEEDERTKWCPMWDK
jgi:hypothetical protein